MKTNNTRSVGRVLSLSATILTALLLVGCDSDKNESKEAQVAPAKTAVASKPAPVRKETTELMPESSNEFSRRHVADEYGRKIELHTRFRNGDEGSKFFRESGGLKEEILKDKSGAVKQQLVYARDGKTVVSGMEARKDGTSKWKLEQKADGSSTKTTYWYDGTRVFSVELTRPDGSIEHSFFRKDGSLWVKKSGKNASSLVADQFDRAGVLQTRTVLLPDGKQEVTRFEKDVATVRQIWQLEKSAWSSYTSWNLTRVDELGADGKVTRTLIPNSGGYSVRETWTPTADGGKLVKRLRWDNSVEVEEMIDKDGQSVSKKDVTERGTPEKIDSGNLRRIENSDPLENWQGQEDYPYRRNQD